MRTPMMWTVLLVGCSGTPDPSSETGDTDVVPTTPATCIAAPERCDGYDNDCDGVIDEDYDLLWYPDRDGDGLGVTAEEVQTCTPESGWVPDAGDCDDADPTLTGPVDAIHYVDATLDANLDWLHWDPSTTPCGYETLAGGVAVGDYNGDEMLDIYFPRLYSQDLLFRNLGDGTFLEVATEAGLGDDQSATAGALWFDIDGDRDLDLYLTSLGPGGARLWVNHGPGTFVEEAALRGVAADFGTDCALTFSSSAADVDGDGDLDLHTSAWFPDGAIDNPRSRLFINDGSGNFTDQTAATGLDLSDRPVFTTRFDDVDSDGWPDLLVAASRGQSTWFRNNEGLSFSEGQNEAAFTDESATGTAVADIDGDGDLDWFISGVFDASATCAPEWGCTGNRLYRNDDGRFIDDTDASGLRDGGFGWGAQFFDHDLDGDLDLVQAAGFEGAGFDSGTGRLWLNDGSGVFTDHTCASGWVDRGQARGVVPFDADDDGDLDIFVVHNGGVPGFWRNTGAEDRGWLRVQLDQPLSNNRFAVGAEIRVIAALGDTALTRRITANSSFSSSGPPEAHFGLGDHMGAIEQVQVTWPDGNVSSFANVTQESMPLIRP